MPKNETTRNLAYYMDLPYTTILRKDEEGDVVARVEELPGCVSHGQNEAEAVENLASMKKLWFEDCLESGEDIPEPEKREPPSSGKWVQRVPRSLHRELTRMAKTEGVSLNQLVTSMLSHQVTTKTAQKTMKNMEEQMLAIFQSKTGRQRSLTHYWDQSACYLPVTWQGKSEPATLLTGLRHIGQLMPTTFEVKIEHSGEPYEDYFFSER